MYEPDERDDEDLENEAEEDEGDEDEDGEEDTDDGGDSADGGDAPEPPQLYEVRCAGDAHHQFTTRNLEAHCPKCDAAIDRGVVVPIEPGPFTDVTEGGEAWFLAIGSLEACLKWVMLVAFVDWFEWVMTYSHQLAIGLSVRRWARIVCPEEWSRYKNISARETLPVELQQWELAEAASRLARLEGRLRDTQIEKKEAAKEYKTTEDGIMKEIHLCAVRIRRGEHRVVDVTITYDYRLGMRTKTRNDTGEIIDERPLTGEERQEDFTQH